MYTLDDIKKEDQEIASAIVFHCPVRMIHLQKIVFEGQVYTDNDAYSVRFSVVFKKVFAQIFHQCIKEKEEPVQTDSSFLLLFLEDDFILISQSKLAFCHIFNIL